MRGLIFLFACLLLAIPCGAEIIYVDDDATGANNGSSWADAYRFLEDALMVASTGDEIWVAQGIYNPTWRYLSQPHPMWFLDLDLRTFTFQLKNGVMIKGGYAGFGEQCPDARDIDAYETILSGDIRSDDGPNFANNEENSFRVVTGSGTDATTVLDGFTITGGNAIGSGATGTYCKGGGMHNQSGSPTVTNCTFRGNFAYNGGGGMSNWINSSPMVTNCTFTENSAGNDGAGMQNYQSSPILTNCVFSGNSADYLGGAMFNSQSSPKVTNCTFSGNSAPVGSALACNSWDSPSNLQLTNCILWDGGSEICNVDGSTITITYSDVQGGWPWPGEGNINADPCFADAANGDYHLKSQAGRWDANEGRWTKDEVTSPCIDGGDMASPIGYEPFPNGGIINMGAYGGTAEASKSHFGEPVCETIVAGDINGDCIVNFEDFALMALHWLQNENR